MKYTAYAGVNTVLDGLITGMPDTAYHATEGHISSSGLNDILRSPAHYFFKDESDRTRGMEFGSAVHTAVLEPDLFKEKYIITSAKARTASVYKEAAKIHGGEFTLTQKEGDDIRMMAENVYLNAEAKRLISESEFKEASIFTTDPATGVRVRVRADILSFKNGFIGDYKSTTDAREHAFSRSICEYGYHVQAALYLSAIEWAFGEKMNDFFLIPQEKTAPYVAEVYQLDDISLTIGKKLMRESLNKYAECMETGNWHPYVGNGEKRLITLPDWVINQFEDENELIIGS